PASRPRAARRVARCGRSRRKRARRDRRAAAAGGVLMSPIDTDPKDPDLAPLRAALTAMPAPVVNEAALRRMFREHRSAQASGARVAAPTRARRYWAVAAAVGSVAIGGVVGLALTRERHAVAP